MCHQICAMHLEYQLPHVDYKLDYIQGGRVSLLVSNIKDTLEAGACTGGHILQLSCMCQNFARGQPSDNFFFNDLCWTNGKCLAYHLHFKPTLGFSN